MVFRWPWTAIHSKGATLTVNGRNDGRCQQCGSWYHNQTNCLAVAVFDSAVLLWILTSNSDIKFCNRKLLKMEILGALLRVLVQPVWVGVVLLYSGHSRLAAHEITILCDFSVPALWVCLLFKSGSDTALSSLLGFYWACLGNATEGESCLSLSDSCDC